MKQKLAELSDEELVQVVGGIVDNSQQNIKIAHDDSSMQVSGCDEIPGLEYIGPYSGGY